jgi:DNA repair exonuclease SbcCD ATPase subunit
MRYDPTLIVKRLIVQRNEYRAYDEAFHEGVNVIRGENSSGKSTILNFIFYGLGGDLADWSDVALLCTRVILEVKLNGHVATLSREISDQHGREMEIFGGDYESARAAPRAEWVRYPYRRSASQESFSQALFRLLGIPEVASDVSGNLTIHQILRLLYSDQLSPVEDLFRYESRFDPPALRDAIGRLLAGAYDAALYDNEVKIRELTREFDAKSGELRSLIAVLGTSEHSLNLDWLQAQLRSIEHERATLQTQIETAERELYTKAGDDEMTLRAQEESYAEVQRLQASLGDAQQERDSLMLAIADSASFITALEHKLAALNDASATAQYIGDVRFSICPACYTVIAPDAEAHSHICHLCKSPLDSERARGRIVAIINDTSLQLRQSRLLQTRRTERVNAVESNLKDTQARWQAAATRLAAVQRLPSSESREKLRELHRQSGYLQRQLEDLNEKAKLIRLIDDISLRKNELNDQIGRLKTQNERLRSSQKKRLERAYTIISDEIRTLLHNDLRRQDSFETADNIQFDFAANRISVDGHSYFSASSRVILKVVSFWDFSRRQQRTSYFATRAS